MLWRFDNKNFVFRFDNIELEHDYNRSTDKIRNFRRQMFNLATIILLLGVFLTNFFRFFSSSNHNSSVIDTTKLITDFILITLFSALLVLELMNERYEIIDYKILAKETKNSIHMAIIYIILLLFSCSQIAALHANDSRFG